MEFLGFPDFGLCKGRADAQVLSPSFEPCYVALATFQCCEKKRFEQAHAKTCGANMNIGTS